MADRSVILFRKISIRLTAVILALSSVCSLCFLSSCAGDNAGFDGKRFSRTRKISVLTDFLTEYASENSVDTSAAAVYIHDRVLSECNIDVRFVESYKLDFHNGIAADISFTENYNELVSYYRMGAVINLSPYLDEYSDALTDLTGLLGEEDIYYCNSDPGEVWYLKPKSDPCSRVTFIRSDWLEKLGLDEPSDINELHECLLAFRDNADLLLGSDASEMIPFLVDSEPDISAKPLFDSYLDTSVSDRDYFSHGYCRIGQDGYDDGLRILNEWYLEGLLPDGFMNISPSSKESYEPVENGYVGAFCAGYDYLYANGENSHLAALHSKCGEYTGYTAVNTFKDRYGNYVSWHEERLHEDGPVVFLPSTCSDPLACLVYLNWISDSENIGSIKNISCGDQYTPERYLLTLGNTDLNENIYDAASCETSRLKATDVSIIRRGSPCVSYGPEIFQYIRSEADLSQVYPGSARELMVSVITAGDGNFDSAYKEAYENYLSKGAGIINTARDEEWEKVMVQGIREPRAL